MQNWGLSKQDSQRANVIQQSVLSLFLLRLFAQVYCVVLSLPLSSLSESGGGGGGGVAGGIPLSNTVIHINATEVGFFFLSFIFPSYFCLCLNQCLTERGGEEFHRYTTKRFKHTLQ